MKYVELNIDTSESGIEPIVAELLSLGFENTVVEDPRDIEDLMEKKETYDWDYLDDSIMEKMKDNPKVTVYMEDGDDNAERVAAVVEAMDALKQRCKAGEFGEGLDFGSLKVTSSIDDDADWKDKWKEYFKPSRISKSIVVKPTWEPYENKGGDLVIEIDPGMAFGTGTHETTSMCVEMLEKYVKKGDKVMDVGCGSGILSIAAALIGSQDVLAVDIDPVAVEVADENIRLNHVEDVARAQYGDLTKGVDYKADVVVANLMADLVVMLSKDVARHLSDGGLFISSGILTEKKELVSGAVIDNGFTIVEIMEKGGWCCIAARKK